MKSCFIYCALYPEDHSIDKAQLIDYWIGEGLILLNEFNHIDEARNHGNDIIGILKSACLLESGKYGETSVKMHGVIRDLALWITRECGRSKTDKMLIIETCDIMVERWYNAERIYLRLPLSHNGTETEVVGSPPKSPNLLTLVFELTHVRLLIPQNFFEFTPLLRVLVLSNCRMETFPISITELLELRYLSLDGTHIKVLPKELGKLVKLNYFILMNNKYLMRIPSGVVGSLVELRVLGSYHCPKNHDVVEELYNLKHLNYLRITINTQHNLNKLLSNQNLQMCTRYLTLLRLPPSSSITTLLKKLEFLSNLETLILVGCLPESNHYYPFRTQQHHQLQPFQNLNQITIIGCSSLKDLTRVGYLPNLKILHVNSCEEIVIIVCTCTSCMTGDVQDVFKRLKTLFLVKLPKVKSICRNALAFPCLESMLVWSCPQLKKLPFDSGSNINNTLQKIQGGPKWWNELQWEEEDHNNNIELLKSKFLPYFDEVSNYDC